MQKIQTGACETLTNQLVRSAKSQREINNPFLLSSVFLKTLNEIDLYLEILPAGREMTRLRKTGGFVKVVWLDVCIRSLSPFFFLFFNHWNLPGSSK